MAFSNTTTTTNLIASNSTRPHWGGTGSNVDIHIELYENEVDTKFKYDSVFRNGMSSHKTVSGRSNQVRIDRMNGVTLRGRRAGEDVVPERVTSDKFNVVVDTMLYTRVHVDYVDDWTAPEFWKEYGENCGTEFALQYDKAHIIRLIKARDWVPPASVSNAFYAGLSAPVTLAARSAAGVELTEEEMEDNAAVLTNVHAKLIETLIKRRVPLGDMVTIVTPAVYSELVHSKKLISTEFSLGNGNFADRRVSKLNGIPVIELTTFPEAVTPNGQVDIMGAQFNVTANDLKGEMVIFSKAKSLVTVTARDYETEFWDNKDVKSYVLDTQGMFTVDVRRPDTIGTVLVTRVPKAD
jgi:hypothetical protein